MKFSRLALFLLAAAGNGATAATTGLDDSFGARGIVLIGPTPTSGIVLSRVSALKVLNDGRILVGGYVWGQADIAPQPAIGRLQADGSWDTSFSDHGLFVLPYGTDPAHFGGRIHNVDVFSDGSVLGTGGIHMMDGHYYSCTLLIKLTASGAMANGFAPDKSGSYCFDFAPPPANTYWFNHSDGARIDSDDSFFLSSIETNLLVGAVAHLDATGTLINTYGTNGIAGLPPRVHSFLLQVRPGQVVSTSGVYVGAGGEQGFGAARLQSGGDVDLTYGSNGAAFTDVHPSSSVGITYGALDGLDRLVLSSYAVVDGNDSPYRIARLTAGGAVDGTFNSANQQPGEPGVAVISLSGNNVYDAILGAQPLPDRHIFVLGRNAAAGNGDGISNISLLRLHDDASWDQSFGDASHPGWASINIGGQADSYGSPGAMDIDPRSGRIVAAIGATDSAGHACFGLIRVVGDRLFDSAFDAPPAMPTCPQ